MKPRMTLPILVLAITALLGCGAQGTRTGADTRLATTASRPSSGAPPSSAIPHYSGMPWFLDDSDGDGDHNSDERIHMPGREGSPSQWRAIAATITRYYSAALADNGGLACRMLAAPFARSMVVEYGRYGPPYLRGNTCVGIASKLFRHEHHLVRELASTQRLIDVRLEGNHGYAAMHVDVPCVPGACVLNVRTVHVAEVLIEQEGESWKMDSLLTNG